jgi:hypothetical protein
LLAARTTLAFSLLAWMTIAGNAFSAEPLEDLLSATFRIADRDHSGTCFLVEGGAIGAPDVRRVALVTAAHVFEQMSGADCELILRKATEDGQFARLVVSIPIRDGNRPRWTRHPELDVATLLVDLPEGTAARPIPFDQIADEARIINRTIRVGQETWIPCYPAKLEANAAGWPILRKGSIASYPLAPVKSTKTMLIDYSTFGGDSGAPIAIVVDDRPVVIGITSSMQRQTDRSSLPFEERTMHTPLGLSIVTHAAHLRDTIELMLSR